MKRVEHRIVRQFKKKATGLACGLVISKRSRARHSWLGQRDTASQEFGCGIHADNIMMFCALRQKLCHRGAITGTPSIRILAAAHPK
jgi:hypothetical protein